MPGPDDLRAEIVAALEAPRKYGDGGWASWPQRLAIHDARHRIADALAPVVAARLDEARREATGAARAADSQKFSEMRDLIDRYRQAYVSFDGALRDTCPAAPEICTFDNCRACGPLARHEATTGSVPGFCGVCGREDAHPIHTFGCRVEALWTAPRVEEDRATLDVARIRADMVRNQYAEPEDTEALIVELAAARADLEAAHAGNRALVGERDAWKAHHDRLSQIAEAEVAEWRDRAKAAEREAMEIGQHIGAYDEQAVDDERAVATLARWCQDAWEAGEQARVHRDVHYEDALTHQGHARRTHAQVATLTAERDAAKREVERLNRKVEQLRATGVSALALKTYNAREGQIYEHMARANRAEAALTNISLMWALRTDRGHQFLAHTDDVPRMRELLDGHVHPDERNEAEDEVERLTAESAHFQREYADACAVIERVEALCNEAEKPPRVVIVGEPLPAPAVRVAKIRAALAGPADATSEGRFVAAPPAPADPLTEARVAESIAAARANQAFMNRLAERIEQDRGLLDRLTVPAVAPAAVDVDALVCWTALTVDGKPHVCIRWPCAEHGQTEPLTLRVAAGRPGREPGPGPLGRKPKAVR